MPGELLKFNGPTEYAIQALEKGEIFCQHYSAYNDPFEFWSNIYHGIPDAEDEPERFMAAKMAWGSETMSPEDEDLVAYFDECQDYQPPFAEMRDGMRIACFGSEPDNLLMWSHYADGLRGFCVVFDEELIVNDDPEAYVVDVAYLDTPPTVDSFVYAISGDQDWYTQMAIEETETRVKCLGQIEEKYWISVYENSGLEARQRMHEILQHVFAVKPSEWEYEGERRLLVQTRAANTQPIRRRYPRSAVKELIVGERMPLDFQERLLAVMHKYYADTPIKTARRAEGQYTLAFT